MVRVAEEAKRSIDKSNLGFDECKLQLAIANAALRERDGRIDTLTHANKNLTKEIASLRLTIGRFVEGHMAEEDDGASPGFVRPRGVGRGGGGVRLARVRRRTSERAKPRDQHGGGARRRSPAVVVVALLTATPAPPGVCACVCLCARRRRGRPQQAAQAGGGREERHGDGRARR